jgi:hypothetical protein
MTEETTPPAPRPAAASSNQLLALAEDARTELARAMNSLVLSAHELAADIDSRAGAPVGDVARAAAELLGSLQRGLAQKPLPELLEDGRSLVRSQPAASLGAAVAAGFIVARLLRSTDRADA